MSSNARKSGQRRRNTTEPINHLSAWDEASPEPELFDDDERSEVDERAMSAD